MNVNTHSSDKFNKSHSLKCLTTISTVQNYLIVSLTSDHFAVRTMSEVTILAYHQLLTHRPSLELFLSLPIPFLNNASAKFISDTTFNSSGTRIAVISNEGHWIVFELEYKRSTVSVVASGSIEFSLVDCDTRRPWWKMQWTDDMNNIAIAESKGLHLLTVEVFP
jgi:hypothetical protein